MVNGTKRYRLIQDDDCHWYIIPENFEGKFAQWEGCMVACEPWDDEWEPVPVNGPHVVVFGSWAVKHPAAS